MFTDLVGFTAYSESRDPEEVRSMLTRYFDRSREIVERFGGTIEKFIGDAVMAVWGAVEAHENDAERAVRAALELVDMVEALGAEIGVPELRLRAGVLTGETSVGPGGNESTGMIVGDLVNSASRLQGAAAPGTVLVGETTQQVSAQAIAYEPVADQEMKGKALAVRAFRAMRVIAQRGGRGAAEGIDPPFVGREDEFRLGKDQIHAAGREMRARLVSIIGEPGIGKSRLAWELEKYVDGITEPVYWHHGRSPDYGESLTFWALGEMIRQRAGIAETDDPAKSRMKLRTTVARYATSEEDQRWIEPRLAGLLGLAEMPPGDGSELFAALRTFFQRIAEGGTTVLVFEDLHWADAGLVEFISELVERSPRSPILVVTLARPDLLDRHPGWGQGRRNTMSIQLAPLADEAMRRLVAGTVPGLPESAIESVLQRAGGVPLYAVEFVRMLLGSGDVVRTADGRFELVGELSDLSVPETIQAVIGSRIDRLPADQRDLIQDAAVLGHSFTLEAIAGLRAEDRESVRRKLLDLVRDEIFELEEDPRSPERGQYRFLQGLIREVAYGRLSRDTRAERHLAVASYYESIGDLEVAAALATHYMAAYEASEGAEHLRDRARLALLDAAERAAGLNSQRQSISLLERALQITGDDADRALLFERLAIAAELLGDTELSVEHALEAATIYGRLNDLAGQRRAATLAGKAHIDAYRMREAQQILESMYDATSTDSDAATLALELELGRAYMFSEPGMAADIVERALRRNAGVLPAATLIDGIINRGNGLARAGRGIESMALIRGAVHVADELELHRQAIRALWNLAVMYQPDNLRLTAEIMADILERARRVGDQAWTYRAAGAVASSLLADGRFEEAEAMFAEFEDEDLPDYVRDELEMGRVIGVLYQSPTDEDFAKARDLIERTLSDPDMRGSWESAHAGVDVLEGDIEAAAARGISELRLSEAIPSDQFFAIAWTRDVERLAAAIEALAGTSLGRYGTGYRHLLVASLDAIEGNIEGALEGFRTVIDIWSRTAPAMELATAQALFAYLVGTSHPEAAAASERAAAWIDAVGATRLRRVLAPGLPAVGGVFRAAGGLGHRRRLRAIRRGPRRFELEHLVDSAEGQVLADANGEIDDLVVGEMLLEASEEVVVDRVVVVGEQFGVLEGDLLDVGELVEIAPPLDSLQRLLFESVTHRRCESIVQSGGALVDTGDSVSDQLVQSGVEFGVVGRPVQGADRVGHGRAVGEGPAVFGLRAVGCDRWEIDTGHGVRAYPPPAQKTMTMVPVHGIRSRPTVPRCPGRHRPGNRHGAGRERFEPHLALRSGADAARVVARRDGRGDDPVHLFARRRAVLRASRRYSGKHLGPRPSGDAPRRRVDRRLPRRLGPSRSGRFRDRSDASGLVRHAEGFHVPDVSARPADRTRARDRASGLRAMVRRWRIQIDPQIAPAARNFSLNPSGTATGAGGNCSST